MGFWSNRKISDCSPTIASSTLAKGYAHPMSGAMSFPGPLPKASAFFVGTVQLSENEWVLEMRTEVAEICRSRDGSSSKLLEGKENTGKQGKCLYSSSMKKWSCSVILFSRRCSSIYRSPFLSGFCTRACRNEILVARGQFQRCLCDFFSRFLFCFVEKLTDLYQRYIIL